MLGTSLASAQPPSAQTESRGEAPTAITSQPPPVTRVFWKFKITALRKHIYSEEITVLILTYTEAGLHLKVGVLCFTRFERIY